MKELVEKLRLIENDHNVDIDFYMSEGCGIYAMAFYNIFGGTITMLQNIGPDAEKWSKKFPYEVTHIMINLNDSYYDVKGKRQISDIISDFNNINYTLYTMTPEFLRKLMGNSDSKPLYGQKKDVNEAEILIKHNTKLHPQN